MEKTDLEVRHAWEIYKYAEEILAQRMNYGMVAQSMLLLCFATLFVSQEKLHPYTVVLEITVALVGLFYSFFQFSRVRMISQKVCFLQDEYLIPGNAVFRDYMAVIPRVQFQRRVRQHQIGLVLATAWLVILSITAVAAGARP